MRTGIRVTLATVLAVGILLAWHAAKAQTTGSAATTPAGNKQVSQAPRPQETFSERSTGARRCA
jgi:hypothetical protein